MRKTIKIVDVFVVNDSEWMFLDVFLMVFSFTLYFQPFLVKTINCPK